LVENNSDDAINTRRDGGSFDLSQERSCGEEQSLINLWVGRCYEWVGRKAG